MVYKELAPLGGGEKWEGGSGQLGSPSSPMLISMMSEANSVASFEPGPASSERGVVDIMLAHLCAVVQRATRFDDMYMVQGGAWFGT